VEEMAACMHTVLRDFELRVRLRQNGIERARQFTWERCARQTLDVLLKAGQVGRD
jgi:glycosyltransferase involved in cell wall biosynthesis